MKKQYDKIVIEVIILDEDIVRTSLTDNTGVMPEFPEDFE